LPKIGCGEKSAPELTSVSEATYVIHGIVIKKD
jgi:hypothetical protein